MMMKQKDSLPQKMIDDARKLYLKYGGREHVQIELEMRAKGWRFYRQMLYSTGHSHGVTEGLPELFGWKALLAANQPIRKTGTDRNRFEVWLSKNFPEFKWAWKYQRHIYRTLNRVTTGECKRLMIFMPPRHGKSEMVTVRYTAWRLMQDPKLNVILASYNQRLADRFSRKIRRVVESGELRVESTGNGEEGFPLSTLNSKLRRLATASEWETTGGGVVRSVGVGGGIAGFGAGLIVIDDPVRSRADAESETKRDRVDEWFKDDIYTRIEPNAAIILIQTRWHEDDLAGRLLKEMAEGGEKWEVISLPAMAEADDPLGRPEGRPLCPQMFDIAKLNRFKKKLGSYSFAALYQQRPMPLEGGQFKRAWFKNVVDRPPEDLRWKRGYDLAVSLKTSADYTASFRCAKDRNGFLYIADGFRNKIEYPDQRRYIIERMKTEPRTEHCIEDALHGKAIVQDLRRERELSRYPLRTVKVQNDKLTRALAWLNLAEEGKVILVRGPWIGDFVDEICTFPNGRHDDQLDAVSLAVQMIGKNPGGKMWTFD